MRKVLASFILGLALILNPAISYAQTTVSVTAKVPSNVSATLSTVVANLVELPADGTSIVVITVTLVDASGNVLENKDVTLSSNRGDVDIIGSYSGNTLTESKTGTTTSAGIVRFAARSYAPGNATFTALADSEVTLNEKPTVTFTPLPAKGNISVVVPLPGGIKIPIITPAQPTTGTQNEESDIANRSLINTRLDLVVPFWIFLVIILFFLMSPTLIILVTLLIRRVKKNHQVIQEYREKEEAYLKQVFALEQQVSNNQQFIYQQDTQISSQLQQAKEEIKETVSAEVSSVVDKVIDKTEETPTQPTEPSAS